mmetsp:Transcript_93396/g.300693  ORF Transcript_93396/g.300693 Transcript_93396/m.300693 type:complete len:206 (+) Transcript_93396:605-1222(+)
MNHRHQAPLEQLHNAIRGTLRQPPSQQLLLLRADEGARRDRDCREALSNQGGDDVLVQRRHGKAGLRRALQQSLRQWIHRRPFASGALGHAEFPRLLMPEGPGSVDDGHGYAIAHQCPKLLRRSIERLLVQRLKHCLLRASRAADLHHHVASGRGVGGPQTRRAPLLPDAGQAAEHATHRCKAAQRLVCSSPCTPERSLVQSPGP